MIALGDLYYNGNGTDKDYVQALNGTNKLQI